MAKQTAIQQFDPDLLSAFAADGERAAAELSGSSRFTPPYLRVAKVKEKAGTKFVVEVVNPAIRDDKNQAQATAFDSLEVVLLEHIMTRRLQYTGPDKKIMNELFSVGPKKGAYAIGSAIGGYMTMSDVDARWPDGFLRNVIEFGSDQVTRKNIKPDSRYYTVLALRDEAAVEAAGGSQLVMAFLSMTSTYGIMIKSNADAEERDLTLMAFPDREDPEKHKGVLHRLLTREWETGAKLGAVGKTIESTPQTAITLIMTGAMLGEVTQPVPAFDIGEELDPEGLKWVAGLKADARQMMMGMIEQGVKDAMPRFNSERLSEYSQLAVAGEFDDLNGVIRLALPATAEVVEEGEDDAEVRVEAEVVSDEFPSESDLPF